MLSWQSQIVLDEMRLGAEDHDQDDADADLEIDLAHDTAERKPSSVHPDELSGSLSGSGGRCCAPGRSVRGPHLGSHLCGP